MTDEREKDENKVAGGYARAESLTPEERTDIARRAAQARWQEDLPEVTHPGELKIGDAVIPCAVIRYPNGTVQRVLSEHGITTALGSRSGASKRRKRAEQADGGGAPVPLFLAPKRLEPFIPDDLRGGPLGAVKYRSERTIAYGYPAELLPKICEVWLAARDAGALQKQQIPRARKAEILMRGLATVGIIALVDEVTGYQDVRDRLALEAILNQYLRQELAAWAKKFPDEFYMEIFRLRGWTWKGMKINRPQCVAQYTKDLVYARMLPRLVRELETRAPKDDRGHRKGKLHQLFTEDVGDPALAQHLHAVVGLMRASRDRDWPGFMRLVDRAFPRQGETLRLPGMD